MGKPDPNRKNQNDWGKGGSRVGKHSSIIGFLGRPVVAKAKNAAADRIENSKPMRGVRKVQNIAEAIRNINKGDCWCGKKPKKRSSYCSDYCTANDPRFTDEN